MAANDNVIGCGNDYDFTKLLAAAIGKDSSGKYTLRLHDSNSVAGSKVFDCNNPYSPQALEAATNGLFTLDANGDIAIRVSLI